HFSKDSLTAALSQKGINYTWMPSLGGHRSKSLDDSPNIALRSGAFRNYADYMLSPEFERAARELVSIAATSRTASMCPKGTIANAIEDCCLTGGKRKNTTSATSPIQVRHMSTK